MAKTVHIGLGVLAAGVAHRAQQPAIGEPLAAQYRLGCARTAAGGDDFFAARGGFNTVHRRHRDAELFGHLARKAFAVGSGGAVHRHRVEFVNCGEALQLLARLIAGADNPNRHRPRHRNLAADHAAACAGAQVGNQLPVQHRQQCAVLQAVERHHVARAHALDAVIRLHRRIAGYWIGRKQDAHRPRFKICHELG